MRRRLLLALTAVAVPGLSFPSSTLADYGLTVRRKMVHPDERVTVWGNACAARRRGMPIYLVPRAAQMFDNVRTRRRPSHRYRYLGRMHCTNTRHPWGDGGFWTGTLRFRVPEIRPGRYRLVIYCNVCRRGPAASLVAALWYFDGRRRIELDSIAVLRAPA